MTKKKTTKAAPKKAATKKKKTEFVDIGGEKVVLKKSTRKSVNNKKLTAQQRIFCNHFLKHLNASEAVREAGYKTNNPAYTGSCLLARPHIREHISREMDRRAKKVELKAENVIKELMLLGFSDISKYDINVETGEVTVKEGESPELIRAIQSVKHRRIKDREGNIVNKVDVKFWSKDRALENLGKHLSMFIEKRVVSGPDDGPVEIEHRKGLTDEMADFIRKQVLGIVE